MRQDKHGDVAQRKSTRFICGQPGFRNSPSLPKKGLTYEISKLDSCMRNYFTGYRMVNSVSLAMDDLIGKRAKLGAEIIKTNHWLGF